MSDRAAAAPVGWLRAMWGGLLSLLWPGLGQIYAGWWWLGITLFVGFTVLDLLVFGLTWLVPPRPDAVVALIGAVVLPRLVVTVDAVRRIRSRWVAGRRPWYRSTWLAAVVLIAIAFGMQPDAVYSPGWRSFHMASASNLPTLLSTDYMLADARRPGALPDYGDVTAFRHPRNPKLVSIKRVVGLPGDLVQLRKGVLYLNGKPVPREALRPAMSFPSEFSGSTFAEYRETLPNGCAYRILQNTGETPPTTDEFKVPPDTFFALGDNRDNSVDSRFMKEVGYIPTANVIGIVVTIYWTGDWMAEPGRLLARVR
ncbi:signal peptidase I [Reyranella sp.]|uniref:signal peptidase I n=1 Tax=Reyranella sp. TaxID=1929291 RepID=UPI003783E32F